MSTRVHTGYQSRIEWVQIDNVEVDIRAQRQSSDARAQKIAASFDPDLLGKPLVVVLLKSNGDERYIVVDGQTRFAAARIALGKGQQLECEVVRDCTLERAAQLFRGRNSSRHPRPIDDFLVGVTAKDPECLAINRIVSALGMTVKSGSAAGNVGAVTALRRIYRMEPKAGLILSSTLKRVIEAWGKTPESVQGDVLIGIGMVLKRHGDEIDETALKKRLTALAGGGGGLLGKGRAIKNGFGGDMPQCVARAVVSIYNTARSTRRLPEWGSASPQETYANGKPPGGNLGLNGMVH